MVIAPNPANRKPDVDLRGSGTHERPPGRYERYHRSLTDLLEAQGNRPGFGGRSGTSLVASDDRHAPLLLEWSELSLPVIGYFAKVSLDEGSRGLVPVYEADPAPWPQDDTGVKTEVVSPEILTV